MSGATAWFVARSGRPIGPVSTAELAYLAGYGYLRGSDRLWRMGLAVWIRAETIPGLLPHEVSRASEDPDAARKRALATALKRLPTLSSLLREEIGRQAAMMTERPRLPRLDAPRPDAMDQRHGRKAIRSAGPGLRQSEPAPTSDPRSLDQCIAHVPPLLGQTICGLLSMRDLRALESAKNPVILAIARHVYEALPGSAKLLAVHTFGRVSFEFMMFELLAELRAQLQERRTEIDLDLWVDELANVWLPDRMRAVHGVTAPPRTVIEKSWGAQPTSAIN